MRNAEGKVGLTMGRDGMEMAANNKFWRKIF